MNVEPACRQIWLDALLHLAALADTLSEADYCSPRYWPVTSNVCFSREGQSRAGYMECLSTVCLALVSRLHGYIPSAQNAGADQVGVDLIRGTARTQSPHARFRVRHTPTLSKS
jgi:hypothetical protein